MINHSFTLPDVPPVEWELLYDATCSMYTHPLQLAAAAKIAGHHPPSPHTARILEIGSALGGNLNTIAETLPEAECIGVDPFLAQTQLAQQRANTSQLKNVRYEAIGIEVADQVLEGEFDYIIAHGFFSWVSDEIRQKTFEFIQKRLSNQGVCYVSYNIYPLWHLQEGTRQLMRWRARYLKDQENCVDATRDIIRNFAQFASPLDAISARDVYHMIHQKLSDKPDYYLAHEYILDHNHPLYFHEFLSFIHQFELAHLVDASFNTEYAALLLSNILIKELKDLSVDYLSCQQYQDFIFNRGLRRSILVKNKQHPIAPSTQVRQASQKTLSYKTQNIPYLNLELQHLAKHYVALPYQFNQNSKIEQSSAHFTSYINTQTSIQIKNPIQISIMILLSAQWPHALPIEECFTQAKALYHGLYPQYSHTHFTEDDFIEALSYIAVREYTVPFMSAMPSLLDEAPRIESPALLKVLQSNLHYTNTPNPGSMRSNKKQHCFINNQYQTPVKISDRLKRLLPYLTGEYTFKSLQKITASTMNPTDLQASLLEAYHLALLQKVDP